MSAAGDCTSIVPAKPALRSRPSSSKRALVIIVLTRGVSEKEGPDGEAFAAEHRREHATLAVMSRKGKMVIAAHSGHHIQLDEPELVIKAIREALEAARK